MKYNFQSQMSTNNIIIAHHKNSEQANDVKAFIHALKIKFETQTDDN